MISAHYTDIASENAMGSQFTSIWHLPCTSTFRLVIPDHLLNSVLQFFTNAGKKKTSVICVHCEVHVGQRNRCSPHAQTYAHITINMAERISFTLISVFFRKHMLLGYVPSIDFEASGRAKH
jgi:hypothetical protein